MKAKSIIAALLLLVAGVQTAMAQKMLVKTTDNGLVRFDVSKVEYVKFIKDDFVDLGLPSGTLWSSCNIGASSPEQYGFYFAWGEKEAKNDYSWLTYRYCKETYDSLTKYCTAEYYGKFDGLDALEDEDDAAAMAWGSPWKVPSMEQFDELMNPENTTVKKTFQDDVYGMLITSKRNGKSIFLPAAGIRTDTDLINEGSRAYYWSRDVVRVDNFLARDFSFTTTSNTPNDTKNRCYGLSIRPVQEHEFVDLGLPSGTLWATCNVGANFPEEYGDYFAWGETTPKSMYGWSTYFDTDDGGSTFKKYNNNGGLTELQSEDDAATANWGSGWQMPSLAQIQELNNSSYTTTVWTQMNGVSGRKITSKSNGNSIFLPAAGYRWRGELYYAVSYGYYWSSSLYPYGGDYAYYLQFLSGDWHWYDNGRYYGQSVRAVRVP